MAFHKALFIFSSKKAEIRRQVIVAIVVIVLTFITGLAWLLTRPAPFSMKVVSRPNSPIGGQVMSLAGQRCVFLLVVDDVGGWLQGVFGIGEAVNILTEWSARMANVTVHPQTIKPRQVYTGELNIEFHDIYSSSSSPWF